MQPWFGLDMLGHFAARVPGRSRARAGTKEPISVTPVVLPCEFWAKSDRLRAKAERACGATAIMVCGSDRRGGGIYERVGWRI